MYRPGREHQLMADHHDPPGYLVDMGIEFFRRTAAEIQNLRIETARFRLSGANKRVAVQRLAVTGQGRARGAP